MTIQHRSALALLPLALACATAAPPSAVKTTARPGLPTAAAAVPPEECGPLTGDEIITPDTTVPDAIRTMVCARSIVRTPEVSQRWYVQRHRAFVEGRTTPLEVATMIVMCVADGSCDPDVDPESFGYMHAYAADFVPAAMEEELTWRNPPAVSNPFRQRALEAVAYLQARAKRMDPRRRALYVELPVGVRGERQAMIDAVAGFAQRTAELEEEIDTTMRSIPSRDRIKQLARMTRALRDEALVQCADKRSLRDCLDGPVVRPLSERLVQLAIAAGEAAQAAAEFEYLRLGSDKSTLAVQLDHALREAVAAHQDLVARCEQARQERTMSDVLLAAAYGTPWPERVPELAWGREEKAADLGKQVAALAKTEKIQGIVRGSRGRGGALEIAFEDTERPVLLDVAEARLLRIGEKLEAIVERGSRRGVVLFAYKVRPSERVVQFRGMRLGGG